MSNEAEIQSDNEDNANENDNNSDDNDDDNDGNNEATRNDSDPEIETGRRKTVFEDTQIKISYSRVAFQKLTTFSLSSHLFGLMIELEKRRRHINDFGIGWN